MFGLKRYRVALLLIVVAMCCGCASSNKGSTTDVAPAVFVPALADYGVDIFVDEIDGRHAAFHELDRIIVEPGSHKLTVRLDLHQQEGSSAVVGGLANFLRDANTSFHGDLTIDAESGQVYRVTARQNDDGHLDLVVFNETTNAEIQKHTFRHRNGKFEQIL